MENDVLVYPSARESGKQIDTQTDEIWREQRRKLKNSAQNGACKFFDWLWKKFLTNGGACDRLYQVGKRFGKSFWKNLKSFEKSSWQTQNDMIE